MRILLAVDGSASADRARDLVAALPWQDGGRVRVVSVAPTTADLLGIPWTQSAVPDYDHIEDDVLGVHRDALEAAEREIRCTRCDLTIEPILRRGRAASVIIEEAREMPADMIVVGHRGHGTWESILLGSVSSEVVDHAPCPVLVARDERIGPIVLADDGSPSARVAEAVLAEWPLFAGLPITVLTVAEDSYPYVSGISPAFGAGPIAGYPESIDAFLRSYREESTAAVERLRSAGFEVHAQMRRGDPAHEIIAAAGERGAGLIVVGTRGQTGLRRLLLGSVARKVLLHAPCSVLVVREGSALAASTFAGNTERESVSPFG